MAAVVAVEGTVVIARVAAVKEDTGNYTNPLI